ncbi:MAG: thioredoxin family protein [Bacteroidota bacterium]
MKKFVLLVPVVLFLLIGSAFRNPAYQPGDTVKDFNLKSVSGKMVSLAGYENAKGAIVVFTCNHCPFSQAYEDRIIALHKMYADKGYPVVAINSNDKDAVPEDSFEEMVKRSKEHSYPFEYIYDETQTVATAFGAARTPHVFVVQKEKAGYVVKYVGAIDDNTDEPKAVTKHYVEDAVNSLLKGEDVAMKSTKAIGCTIKWKK